ncbi:MAG: hypothetical protein HUJ25_05585 [Crocinitomicaceae bacterium]|nr:hypothetical protein [Crocinitomicaceae bacterium]
MSYFGRSNRAAKFVAKSSNYSKPLNSSGGMYDSSNSALGKEGEAIKDTKKSAYEIEKVKAEIAAKIQRRNRTKTIAIIIAGSMLLIFTVVFLYVSENG